MICSHALRKSGTTEKVPPLATAKLWQGDQVVIKTAGGGGVGSPRERDPKQVLDYVLEGRLSAENASQAYGFKADPPRE